MTGRNELEETVDLFLGMDAEMFSRFVLSHLGQEVPSEIWDALSHDDVVLRTNDVLKARLAVVGAQLARDDSRTREMGDDEYATWRRKANGFYQLLANRRAQIRSIVRRVGSGDSDRLRMLTNQLAVEIDAHRRASIAADLDPEPHDRRLWSVLEALEVPADDPNGEPATLADLVTNGAWHQPGPLAAAIERVGVAA